MIRDDFATLLKRYRERAKCSRNGLALQVAVDPSYLTRIENGQRDVPRQHIVEAIATGLRLTMIERNRLLVAAGYAPFSIVQLGTWDASLQEVVDVLNDRTISDAQRQEFRAIVIALAGQYRVWRNGTAARLRVAGEVG